MNAITPVVTSEVTAIPPMPPKVAAAISKVMGGVPKLARGEKNTHGNYNFASIDDFLEAVRPLCAESGLIILQDEAASEMIDGVDKYGKPKRWLSVTYNFTLAHSSGETWAHRPSRTIIVDAAMGSQAFGSAQSYTLKLFERSLFQIATGEKGQDVDEHPNADLPVNGRKRTRAEISEAADFKRGEAKRVQDDVNQITSFIALDKYKREVLTPEFMAKLGNGQWGIEEMFRRREEELIREHQSAVADDQIRALGPPDFPDVDAKRRDALIERIQRTDDEDSLIALRDDDDEYKRIFNMLPMPMQTAVRKAGATKLEALRMASMSVVSAG